MNELITDYLKNNYSDIISKKNNYDQIDFKEFLLRKCKNNFFIDNSKTDEKLKIIFDKEYFDIKKNYFIKYGTKQCINFNELMFYQRYMGLEGPKYHELNDPIFVVKDNGKLILWEGYHRVLYKIINGVFEFDCYLIEINDSKK